MSAPQALFDVLYGFVPITEWEEKVIGSPFFQRLRWIKQLGFAHFVFPGAEHNRLAHAIGVMHSMDQMLRALGLAVTQQELMDCHATSSAAMLHKSLRMAALLHDIGTFPFSHAIENAYIRVNRQHNHEQLGTHIIKNTRFPGGITNILEQYHFDVDEISRIINGTSSNLIANQLMHSDLDADRMDYLHRDAHFTGLKYGQFDRDFILQNLETYHTPQLGFAIKESAAQAAQDFLMGRFNWYSQIIKNPVSAKFDILSSHIASSFLEHTCIFQFSDLLEMVQTNDQRFHFWNDVAFMTTCQTIESGTVLLPEKARDMVHRLLYRIPPRALQHPLLTHHFIRHRDKKNLLEKVIELASILQDAVKQAPQDAWLLVDIPERDIMFTKPHPEPGSHLRDPLKICTKQGTIVLLSNMPNTMISHMAEFIHFIPSFYASESAQDYFRMQHLTA